MADEDDVEVLDQDNEQEADQEQEQQPVTVEALASELGWAPKDKWRGNPEEWVDAAEFVRAGAAMRNKTLAKQDRELAELKQTMQDAREMIRSTDERAHKAEQRAYERAKAEYEDRLREAIEGEDAEAAARAQAALDGLEEPAPPPRPSDQRQQSDPVFETFQEANPWYGKDYEMSAFANSIAEIVRGNGFVGQAFYDEIARATKEKFADRGKNPARKRAPTVEGGGRVGGGNGTNGRSYADLPPEAKAACDRFIKQKMFVGADGNPLPIDKARAKYCERYDWE